jgi:hypothetical protein
MARMVGGEAGGTGLSCGCNRAGAFLPLPLTAILWGQSSYRFPVQISLDSAIVLADLSYTFLSDSCTPEDMGQPLWLQILSQISLAITVIFLLELFACVWAFGPRYYSPFQSILHFCDGSVIVLTFVVDVILRGRERELASLLILFRLLRFAAEGQDSECHCVLGTELSHSRCRCRRAKRKHFKGVGRRSEGTRGENAGSSGCSGGNSDAQGQDLRVEWWFMNQWEIWGLGTLLLTINSQ